jgi:hypothetical protein
VWVLQSVSLACLAVEMTGKTNNRQPLIFLAGGMCVIVISGALLLAHLPTGPYAYVLGVLIGLTLFLGGLITYVRRRRINDVVKGSASVSSRTSSETGTTSSGSSGLAESLSPETRMTKRWELSRGWLTLLPVVSVVVLPLELPAAIGGQLVGIVGIVVSGIVFIATTALLLTKSHRAKSAQRDVK